MDLVQTVTKRHAGPMVRSYVLYLYFFAGFSRAVLATLFHKSKSTISDWINKYDDGQGVDRKKRDNVYLKFDREQRIWIVDLYTARPTLYLDEAKRKFERHFQKAISKSTVSIILHDAGMTWKVLERRAIEITSAEIIRFTTELFEVP